MSGQRTSPVLGQFGFAYGLVPFYLPLPVQSAENGYLTKLNVKGGGEYIYISHRGCCLHHHIVLYVQSTER